jgi:hypothetical protein
MELANSWLSVMSPPISATPDESSSSRFSPSSPEAQLATGDTMLCDDDAHGKQPASLSGSKRPWADSPMSTESEAMALKRQRREVSPSPCYELSDSQAAPMSEAQSTGLTLVADAEASATTPFLGVASRPRYPPRSGGLKRQRREVPPSPSYGLGDSQADPMSKAQSTGLTLVADAEASATTPIPGDAFHPRHELTAQELQEFRSNPDPTRQTDYGFSSCPPRSGVRFARYQQRLPWGRTRLRLNNACSAPS